MIRTTAANPPDGYESGSFSVQHLPVPPQSHSLHWGPACRVTTHTYQQHKPHHLPEGFTLNLDLSALRREADQSTDMAYMYISHGNMESC